MRLAAPCKPRNAVNCSSLQLQQAATRWCARGINTKSRHERVAPIVEQINLRPQPNPRAQSIGVLGGGITGLATAWHLSRLIPDAKITVYEKQSRLGGWLDSEIIEADGGEVLFEWGPRSLRPDAAGSGRATTMMLLQLKLQHDIIGVTKTSPAALNRFIYYGNRLVKMPGPNPNLPTFANAFQNGLKLFTEPIFAGLPGSILAEYWVQVRSASMTDESVGDFIRRRFGKTAADNLASAFFHGIYAGDIYKLSARTLLPALWHLETRDPEGAGVLMEMADIAFKGQGLMQLKHGRYVDLLEAAQDDGDDLGVPFMQFINQDLSVYTFGRGLQRLNDRLLESLKEKENINFHTDANVTEVKFDHKSKKTSVVVEDQSETYQHDYVVSTLSAKKLAEFMETSVAARGTTLNSDTQKALKSADKSVNVGVVNLYYTNPDLIPSNQRGFGYLIPRSIDLDQNPERALGVIFSSETSGVRGPDAFRIEDNPLKSWLKDFEQPIEDFKKDKTLDEEDHKRVEEIIRKQTEKVKDSPDKLEIRAGQDTAPGTKLTVMLGGHWWDGWEKEDLPSEEELIEMAKSLLARHLKITDAPLVAKARVNHDCIPQYYVGYRQRMASIHRGLMEEFQGRLKVAGPWWQGAVGVNDCIQGAHITAFNIREEWDEETGLKEYTEREKWLICDRRTQTFAIDTGK